MYSYSAMLCPGLPFPLPRKPLSEVNAATSSEIKKQPDVFLSTTSISKQEAVSTSITLLLV